MSSFEPRNPKLYYALVDAFRQVRVKDPGTPMRVAGYQAVMLPDGRQGLRAIIADRGETYVVSCRLCTDTRYRLYICHKWAERDPVTGDSNLHLCHCFNEACTASGDGQLELARLVLGWGAKRKQEEEEADELYPEGQISKAPKKRTRRH